MPFTWPSQRRLACSLSDTSSFSFPLFRSWSAAALRARPAAPSLGPPAVNPDVERAPETRPMGSTSEPAVVVIQVVPSLYVDHPTLIPRQWQSCASMSCPPAARHSEVIDPLLVLRGRGEKKEEDVSMIRLPSLHSHSGASSKEGDREKREGREGGEGWGCCSEKMMRRLFSEPADRRGERGGGRRGGGGVDSLNPRWVMWVSRFLTHPAIFSGSTASSILWSESLLSRYQPRPSAVGARCLHQP